jgi:predicted acylesterase/phospholipase RssA
MNSAPATVLILAALLAAGCVSGVRRPAPPFEYSDAAPVGFPATVRIVEEAPAAFETRSRQVLAAARTAAAGGPIRVLALSGGGTGAAFGAGALTGWSQLGTRPEFQIVTGVSAGALMAPFAFLGPAWDGPLAEIFSGQRTQHLLQPQWLRALFGASVYRGRPLFRLVDHYVTDGLLREIAAQSAKGRLLLVATTDLDTEQTVIWNLGLIAAQGGSGARSLLRDVIIASASIPGVFPPVMIRVGAAGRRFEEMHVDGSTTAPLFIAPELATVLPVESNTLRGASVYVIVNGQFGAPTATTPNRTVAILKRSFAAASQSSSRTAVEIALALAQRYGMQLRVTQIPNDYPYRGPLDAEPTRMEALFRFGVQCALHDELWSTPLELLDHIEAARVRPPSAAPDCPAPARAGGGAGSP